MGTGKKQHWAPSAGSIRVQSALERRARWWVPWVAGAVLCAVALIGWSECHDDPAPSVFGGEPVRSVPNELPHPEPPH